jgi:hypothetical protein
MELFEDENFERSVPNLLWRQESMMLMGTMPLVAGGK